MKANVRVVLQDVKDGAEKILVDCGLSGAESKQSHQPHSQVIESSGLTCLFEVAVPFTP